MKFFLTSSLVAGSQNTVDHDHDHDHADEVSSQV
jgi:hypothetical protein